MAIDRLLDNIYHTEVDTPVPNLYAFLEAQKIYFEGGGQSTTEVNDRYVLFLPLLSDIKNSYYYNPTGFKTLLQDVIDAIDALGHGSLPFTSDLTHTQLIVDKHEKYLDYKSQLDKVKRHFERTQEGYLSFLTRLRSNDLDKSNLENIAMSQANVMDLSSDRDLFDAILDTLTGGDYLESVKDLYKEVLEVKYASTSTDLILAIFNLFVSDIQTELDEFIPTIVTLDTSLSSKISVSGKETGYDEVSEADLILTSVNEISNLIEEGFKVTYVINNSAQNFTIDDQSISDSLKVDNLDLELTMNTMVAILNTNTVYQGVLINYLDIESEVANQATIATELASLNAEMAALTTAIGGGAPIVDHEMANLANRLDLKQTEANESAKNLDKYGKESLSLSQAQNTNSSQSDKIKDHFATQLSDKQSILAGAVTVSSALYLSSQSDVQDMIDALDSAKGEITALSLAISLVNDPNSTVESLFNALAAPIEATLLIANAAICTLKAAQCALCVVKDLVLKAIDTVVDIYNKAQSLINGDTDYAAIISDLKDDIVDGFASILPSSACSEVQAQKQADMADVRTALAGTGLNDDAGSTDLTDKQEEWSDAVTDVCAGFFATIPSALQTVLEDEFGDFVEELKSSVENTVDNLYTLADGCSTCEPPDFGGIDLPSVKLPDLSFPDFVLKIPYLDSKVIKCD